MSGQLQGAATATLTTLAGEIVAEHDAAQGAFRSAVEHAIRCGELLIEAKAEIGHGGWGGWLEENFPASDRTARGYMRLARHGDELNRQGLAELGIEGALKQLAAPKQEQDPPHRPKREDYGEGHLEEARFILDEQRHAEDCLVAHYRAVVAGAAEHIAADPVAGSALVSLAATGIEFLIADRRQEQTEGDLEWAGTFKQAGKAWRVHRQARDAWYAAIGEPLMDERPTDFHDAMFSSDAGEQDGETRS